MKTLYITLIIGFNLSLNAQVDSTLKEIMTDVIITFPATIDADFLLKDLDREYQHKFLAPIQKTSNIDFQSACKLGIYRKNLKYTAVYQQESDALKYLGVIEDLSKKLEIDKAIDFEQMNQILKGNNPDSAYVTLIHLAKINERFIK